LPIHGVEKPLEIFPFRFGFAVGIGEIHRVQNTVVGQQDRVFRECDEDDAVEYLLRQADRVLGGNLRMVV